MGAQKNSVMQVNRGCKVGLLAIALVSLPVVATGTEPPPSPAAQITDDGRKPGVRLQHELRHRVDVAGVVGTGDGKFVVVLRTQNAPIRYLPIWIGETEALSIRLRLERQEPPRPLTLNLLESVMNQSDIHVTEINIDDLRGGIFLGNLRFRRGKRLFKLEARPSDAIGLAVTGDAPIWVTEKVLRRAAVNRQELREDNPTPVTPPRSPSPSYDPGIPGPEDLGLPVPGEQTL